MASESKYWFPAKTYGWGWGLPTWPFLGYTLVLTVALVGICWMKGEPPGWRWGGKRPAS